MTLTLDVNFGDPVTPGALSVSFPQLLVSETFSLLSYPIETILAEKLTTAAHRGVVLRSVAQVVQQLPLRRQEAYAAWRRRQTVDLDSYPEDFSAVVRAVTLFADPLIAGEAAGRRWSAASRSWFTSA